MMFIQPVKYLENHNAQDKSIKIPEKGKLKELVDCENSIYPYETTSRGGNHTVYSPINIEPTNTQTIREELILHSLGNVVTKYSVF